MIYESERIKHNYIITLCVLQLARTMMNDEWRSNTDIGMVEIMIYHLLVSRRQRPTSHRDNTVATLQRMMSSEHS